jgi:hypothetical protein
MPLNLGRFRSVAGFKFFGRPLHDPFLLASAKHYRKEVKCARPGLREMGEFDKAIARMYESDSSSF